jgi:hypothetical protein
MRPNNFHVPKEEYSMQLHRRNILLGTTVMLAASPLAGCPTTVDSTSQTIAALITKVQAGVAAACKTAGVVVPTADSVFAVLSVLADTVFHTAGVAALTEQAVSQAIHEIVAHCPAPASKAIAIVAAEPPKVRGVAIKWY